MGDVSLSGTGRSRSHDRAATVLARTSHTHTLTRDAHRYVRRRAVTPPPDTRTGVTHTIETHTLHHGLTYASYAVISSTKTETACGLVRMSAMFADPVKKIMT